MNTPSGDTEKEDCLALLAAHGYHGSGDTPLLTAVNAVIAALPQFKATKCTFSQPNDGKVAVREIQLPGTHLWIPICEQHLEVADCNYPGAKTRKLTRG